jgi:hypothetical protein
MKTPYIIGVALTPTMGKKRHKQATENLGQFLKLLRWICPEHIKYDRLALVLVFFLVVMTSLVVLLEKSIALVGALDPTFNFFPIKL